MSQPIKERVHKNKKTSENIESYPLILPSGFILTKNVFINSYSISGQIWCTSRGLYQPIQWSVTTHPGVCNNTSRVCNSTSAVSILRNADSGCVVTDSGCVVTDSWMCCYRFLDGLIQTPGCAPYFGRRCCSYL
jgi:hypothetical protein